MGSAHCKVKSWIWVVESKENQLLTEINSFIVSIIVSANFLSVFFYKYFDIQSPLPILFSVCFLVALLINRIILNKWIGIFILYVLLFFGISVLQNNEALINSRFFESFLGFGVIPMIVISYTSNFESVIKYVSYFYIFLSFLTVKIDYVTLLPAEKMFYGYIFLPAIFSLHYMLVREEKFVKKVIFGAVLLYYLKIILITGTRGVIFSVIVYFALFCYKALRKKRLLVYLLLIIIGLLYSINWLDILIRINSFLLNHNIYIYSIGHLLETIMTERFDNGRFTLYFIALQLFKKNILFGNGIGSFYCFTSIYYPHNFVIQMLSENGLLFTIPFIIIIAGGFYYGYITTPNWVSSYPFIFLFSLSIPKLMVSSVFWREQNFWLFLSVCLLQLGRQFDLQRRNKKYRAIIKQKEDFGMGCITNVD